MGKIPTDFSRGWIMLLNNMSDYFLPLCLSVQVTPKITRAQTEETFHLLALCIQHRMKQTWHMHHLLHMLFSQL